MKSAVFSLASLVFALGLAGTFGYGYSSYGGYGSYGNNMGYSGYGHKGGLEQTAYIPYAVSVPQPLPAAAGAVGGSSGDLFSDETLLFLIPLFLILLTTSNTSG